ncbi:MAG: DUF86 domain-containing protein [Pedobacter sp.]|nr:MAG: DUF86 domain-containing protein [Pedobacter sp.]
MQRDLRKYLTDIDIHIDYIDEFLKGERDFSIYTNNITIQYAVERALGIIGEAANQLRKIQPDIAISGLHQIISLRNILIHAYDGINNAVIWSVVVNHLPILKVEIRILMEELGDA